MSTNEVPIVSFLKEVMRRKKRRPSPLPADLGFSQATVIRWLAGEDVPNTRSCHRLAQYSGEPLEKVLSLAGHMPEINEEVPTEWPEFGEYARRKYPNELNDDLITIIEDIIKRKRDKRHGSSVIP